MEVVHKEANIPKLVILKEVVGAFHGNLPQVT
jgi:hypothetical protein